MKQPCNKCGSGMFKSFDELHTICVSCGTLKATDIQPLEVSKEEFESRKQPRRVPAEMVAVRVHINEIRETITEMVADGIGWKNIVDRLKINCHWKTARNIYLSRVKPASTVPMCGKVASAKIKAEILAKWDVVQATDGSTDKVMATAGLTMSASSFLRHKERIEREMAA